jgi:hypothetical protein
MIRLNATDYRLCLLDTNAVSELVKRQSFLRNFFKWAFDAAPAYIPSFTLFTVLELRRKPELYQQFLERFGPLPSMLLKSHEQLLEEETRYYPDPSGVDPSLLGFSGELGSAGNHLGKVLPFAFSDAAIAEKERYWNEGEQEIVAGIVSLVPNYPPSKGSAYDASEVRLFLQMAGLQQLGLRAEGFAESVLAGSQPVEIDAFPSLKTSLYTVFHKFYADRNRKPTRSDGFDIINSAATPYVDAVVTENHQAEVLRKTMNRDDFISELQVFTLKDFRDVPP